MWILRFLPDWIFYLILLAGIIGVVVSNFIPIKAIRIVSAIAIVIGLYMSGAIHDNDAWESRVKELEAKMKIAEKESIKANDSINEKTRQNQSQIQKNTIIVKQYIDRELKIYDSQCVIPKEFIKAHNDATEVNK